jgi:hypothetical protein
MSRQKLKRSIAGLKKGCDDSEGDVGDDVGGQNSFIGFSLEPGAVYIPLTGPRSNRGIA